MKTEIRLALLCLAATSVPAFAQSPPECGLANFDQGRNFFTIKSPAAGAINQQCFLTVTPKPGSTAAFPSLASYPSPSIQEGRYEIELSGGGGGGGSGGLFSSGGGGAGAVPSKTTRYLAPGVYRLTIGTGGESGRSSSGGAGNPTSISNAYTQETVYGFPGAETWAGTPRDTTFASARGTPRGGMAGGSTDAGGQGSGGDGVAGQSDGGDGGQKDKEGRLVKSSQDGGMLKVAGYTAPGGKAGANSGGGGGGAGYGKGGDGEATSQTGSRGGDGFISLRALDPIAQAPMAAPAPAPMAPAYVAPVERSVAPAMKPRRDRN